MFVQINKKSVPGIWKEKNDYEYIRLIIYQSMLNFRYSFIQTSWRDLNDQLTVII